MKYLYAIILVLALSPVFAQTPTDDLSTAQALMRLQDFSGAAEKFTAYIAGNGKKNNHLNIKVGLAYWGRGEANNKLMNTKAAINDLNAALAYYKNNNIARSGIYYDRGRTYAGARDFTSAIKDFDQAIALNDKNGLVYIDRGMAHADKNEYQLAIDDYTKGMFSAKLTETQTGLIYQFRGDCKSRLNKYTDAIKDFNEALNHDSNLKNTYTSRGYALQQNGDYDLSLADYTKALTLFRGNNKSLAMIYDQRAINFSRLYQFDKAIDEVTQGLALDPDRNLLHWTKANIYTQTGQCELAIAAYTKLLTYFPDDKSTLAGLHANITTEYYNVKKFDKAMEECKAALALNNADYSTNFLLGKIYLKHQTDKKLATENFNKVIALDTTKSSVSYIFSQFYTGNTHTAMALLQKEVLKQTAVTDAVNSYYNIACMFSIMNDPEKANIYLKKVLDAGFSKQFAANDEDFDNIRNTPAYVAMMAPSG